MQIVTGPSTGPTLVLAHGAGAPMDSPFMNEVADGLAGRGVRVVRFEFPYMARRRDGRSRPPPDRAPVLFASFREIVGSFAEPVFVGGKSMGGRMASMIVDEVGARGLVCLGYPFRSPRSAARDDRVAHLRCLRAPALIVQGTRDPFGGRGEIDEATLAARVHWLEDGDHDFKPRVRSGRTHRQNLAEAVEAVAAFVSSSA